MTGRFRSQLGVIALLLVVVWWSGTGRAWAAGVSVASRPIAKVSIEGVKEVRAQLVRNQLSTKAGQPYDPEVVAKDIQNITRLGRFSRVSVRVDPNPDGTVNVTFVVEEQPLLSDVQVVGNRRFSDQEILNKILLRAGDPRDPYLIERARGMIRKMYQDAGYFLADVDVNPQTLSDTGILILHVREGPRVKVRKVDVKGNHAYTANYLRSKIETSRYIPIFAKGVLSREQLDQDVARLRDFYQEQGYLDARVGRRIELSDDQSDARVTFVIDEGRRYTVSSIRIKDNKLYTDPEIREAMALKLGDVFSTQRLRQTQEALQDLYGKLGYIETKVAIQRVFDETSPTVSLTVNIDESRRYTVGAVIIRGNALTKDKVVRREIRGLEPGRHYDSTGIGVSERRIKETGLFNDAKITVLGDPGDEVRDSLVEVKEANTGSISFGAAVSSDSGLFGAIDLTQRNFDIKDTPDSWGELMSGRAFRGAGQFFQISLQPGTEFQRYSVTFRDPYIFDTDYFLDTSAYYYNRLREEWTEQRMGGTVGIGKRFGDVWSASVRTRAELVEAKDLQKDAPIDAFAAQGQQFIPGLGFFVSRDTTDSRFFPTQGTRAQIGAEEVFGDVTFTKLTAEWHGYVTLDEDFFGRKTILSFRTEAGYILNNDTQLAIDNTGTPHQISAVPLYERFYAGGERSFRGFDFRGAGPRGFRQDTGTLSDWPVGGDWMFLVGAEYNFPIYDKWVRGVFFVDSGTVQPDVGFDQWRVSVGTGLRLTLPFFGQAPFAFDIAYPVVKQKGDQVRYFSFDIALPF